jgi:hypothetical protein
MDTTRRFWRDVEDRGNTSVFFAEYRKRVVEPGGLSAAAFEPSTMQDFQPKQPDRTAAEVASDLRISRRALESILASDLPRAPDDRRFQFHAWRLSKRIWSPAAYEALKSAIERESEPGGVLVSKKRQQAQKSGVSFKFVTDKRAREAYDAVMNWRPDSWYEGTTKRKRVLPRPKRVRVIRTPISH